MSSPTTPAKRTPRRELAPGSVFAHRYEIVREVGAGSFGTVYQARHVHTLRVVALKVLHKHTAEDEAARERFKREVQAPAQIRHPGIVEVYDAHVDEGGRPFVAMRWLEGETLRAHFESQTPTLGRVLELFEQLLDALAAAHDAGFVHRDLKPDNVFVEQTEAGPALRILDFGLARRVQSTSVTHTGTALGTPRYMSPEQFMNAKQAGPTADVWAVGAMLYEALSGEPPFREHTSHALMLKVLTTPPRPLVELAPHVPRTLASVVERCLCKERVGRPADGRALLREIRTLRAVLAPNDSTKPLALGTTGGAPTAPAWQPPANPVSPPSVDTSSDRITTPRSASAPQPSREASAAAPSSPAPAAAVPATAPPRPSPATPGSGTSAAAVGAALASPVPAQPVPVIAGPSSVAAGATAAPSAAGRRTWAWVLAALALVGAFIAAGVGAYWFSDSRPASASDREPPIPAPGPAPAPPAVIAPDELMQPVEHAPDPTEPVPTDAPPPLDPAAAAAGHGWPAPRTSAPEPPAPRAPASPVPPIPSVGSLPELPAGLDELNPQRLPLP